MNSRKFIIADELEKTHFVELFTDQRKRSVTINSYSAGNYSTVTVDMTQFKRAVDEMNG